MESIKDFLKRYGRYKLSIQHLDKLGGCWKIQIYNTTYDVFEPVFDHYITDEEVDNLNIDFETIITTIILNWWEDINKQ